MMIGVGRERDCLFHVVAQWQIVTVSSVHSNQPVRLLTFMRVIAFTHSPQNTVVAILGQSLPACRIIFIFETFDPRLGRHPDFDLPQREKLQNVGAKSHTAVAID